MDKEDARLWLQAVQAITTIALFLLAFYQLNKEYHWRRKQAAVAMIAEWNRNTAVHRSEIEDRKPGLLDRSGRLRYVSLSTAEAHDLHFATSDDSKAWTLKCHVIELLNYCEYIATSYQNQVADRAILAGSFRDTIESWYDNLQPIIQEHVDHRGYNPWAPLTYLLEHEWMSADRTIVAMTPAPVHAAEASPA